MKKNKEVGFSIGDMVFATSAKDINEYHNGYITSLYISDYDGSLYILIDNKKWVNLMEYTIQSFNLERDKDKLFPLMSF